MVAALTNAGDEGYRLLGAYGSWTPSDLIFDAYSMGVLTTREGNNLTVAMGPPIIADNDAAWRELRITGVFQEGSHSVTLRREDRSQYLANLSGDYSQWAFNTMPYRFAVGNSYSVEILR